MCKTDRYTNKYGAPIKTIRERYPGKYVGNIDASIAITFLVSSPPSQAPSSHGRRSPGALAAMAPSQALPVWEEQPSPRSSVLTRSSVMSVLTHTSSLQQLYF